MEAKHTPGPWEMVEHSWSRTGIYAKAIGIAALDIADEATEETQEEWQAMMAANARLIAAAPDLLSACQSAISHLEWSLTAEDPRCVAMRAAIAKATT